MSYYGLPVLKPPVWTWEVPAYFFVGGAAGAAAVIGAVGRATGAPASLVRDARWIAAAGGAISPALLVSDLGRPERFLNMLRVFKLQSPMSVGAWTLVAFSNAAAASAFADAVSRSSGGRIPARVVADAAGVLSAATGVVLSTYTGVLLGATAIPVWARNVRLLPMHFGASSVGAAAALLELAGHRTRSLHYLAMGAAAIEFAVGLSLERDPTGVPDQPDRLAQAGGFMSGAVPLAIRLVAGRSFHARRIAAMATLAGSMLTRIAWVEAGRRSALASRPLDQPPAH
jgi:formate-dependent nitrite reductase membrane component NrfD